MKTKISKDQFNKLPSHVQAMFSEAGDGYEMDLLQLPDVSALKNAKQHEVDQRKALQAELKTLKDTHEAAEAELTTLREAAKSTVPKANLDALESSYKTQLAKKEKDLTERINKLTGDLTSVYVNKAASDLAGEISTAPDLLLPHIINRLSMGEDADGKPITRVLVDGKPSAMTVEDLKKELLAVKSFAPILKATKSVGSGAPGSSHGSGASKGGESKPFNYATASPKEISDRLKAEGKVTAEE